MLIENEVFNAGHAPPSPLNWDENIFRYCTFDGLDLDGLSFGGIIECCSVQSCDLYWLFFNCALISRTRFEDCTFRGASFRGTSFVDCTFTRCEFLLDNLGGDCTIDDCIFAACALEYCTWTNKPGRTQQDITRTRWLGCRQSRCVGLAGVL